MNDQLPAFLILFFIVLYAGIFAVVVWIYSRVVTKAGYPWPYVFFLFVPVANIVMFCLFAFKEWPVERELALTRAALLEATGSPYPPGSLLSDSSFGGDGYRKPYMGVGGQVPGSYPTGSYPTGSYPGQYDQGQQSAFGGGYQDVSGFGFGGYSGGSDADALPQYKLPYQGQNGQDGQNGAGPQTPGQSNPYGPRA